MSTAPNLYERFAGLLLGTAVGDALGLPAEGLSRKRIERRWHGDWRHRFLFGRGMCSDDTEHTFFVAQSLLACPDDPAAFQRCLSWKLRLWLLGLPAGTGFATLRSILKLWLGFPPARSGVRSAGNGPAMRSAIIGAYFYDDAPKRQAFVSAATRLTHTDPRAETAAWAVAEAAAWAVLQQKPLGELVSSLAQLGEDREWHSVCERLAGALAAGHPVSSFAEALGQKDGVSGYAYHSVPVAIYAWLRAPHDFRQALTSALNCGGDTDTVGAIVGSLAGASAEIHSIPPEWRGGIWEWPRTTKVLGDVAGRLAQRKNGALGFRSVNYFWPGLIPRNLVFLAAVLVHGFGRLLK